MKTNKIKQTKSALLDALEKSLGVVTMACKMVGIGRTTFYNYINTDDDFRAKVEELENVVLDFAESQLHKQVKEGNVAATIFLLKTKGKKRGYIERSEFDHTTKGEKINVSINIAGDDLSSDDIE
jgi:hypothetical protein